MRYRMAMVFFPAGTVNRDPGAGRFVVGADDSRFGFQSLPQTTVQADEAEARQKQGADRG